MSVTAIAIAVTTVVAMVVILDSNAARTAERLASLDAGIISATLDEEQAWRRDDAAMLQPLRDDRNIVAAGTLTFLPQARRLSVTDVRTGTTQSAVAAIATREGLAARGASIKQGVPFAIEAVLQQDPMVALIGARLARDLGVQFNGGTRLIQVEGVALTVVGIVVDNERESALATAVILHPRTAEMIGLRPASQTMVVAVAGSSSALVSSYLATALAPEGPDRVTVAFAQGPQALRQQLLADSASFVVVVIAVLIVVTVFSIVVTMNSSILERRREIGVSRALGMSRLRVLTAFMVEAILLGVSGAIVGFVIGTLAAAAMAFTTDMPFLVTRALLLVPPATVLLSALAGAVPAYRASTIHPAALLRAL